MLLATVGMLLMLSANDLISLYLGLELQSLALYVVAAFRRDDLRSTEAGMKYFVLGALSSGMLLYGASMVYGFTGTTAFVDIAAVLTQPASGVPPVGVIVGIVLVIAGLAFKVSAVPFHMWTPDVYEGAPTPVTAFFAAAPKAGGDGSARAGHDGAVRPYGRRNGSRSSSSSPSPRWCWARSPPSTRRTSSA